MPHPAALFDHLLHPVEGFRFDDGLMAIFDVILWNRTVVPDDLLRQVIGGVMLLEQRTAFVFLVRQNGFDCALIPHILALRRFDAHLCQLFRYSLEGETLEELTVQWAKENNKLYVGDDPNHKYKRLTQIDGCNKWCYMIYLPD